MKEPGQIAYENSGPATSWRQLDDINRARFACIEAAVRADERERCAKVATDANLLGYPLPTREAIAAAIRNRGERA